MTKKKDKQRTLFILCFLLPPVLLYAILYVWPFIYAFFISLFTWSGYSADMTFCGLDNYRQAFADPIVWKACLHNLFFLVFCTIVTLVLSMLKGILETLGLGDWVVNWLGDKRYVLGALVAPQAWMYIGFYMVLFIAAIQNIPEDYYESATLEGAGQIRQFFSITLPLMWGTFRIALVHLVANAFEKTFAIVHIVTKGGPSHASEVLTTYLYSQAFQYGRFGYGSTIGVILFVIVAVISLTIYRVTRRDAIEF